MILLDELPPEPRETASQPELDRPHGLAVFDIASVDESIRWRLDLALEAKGIARVWDGPVLSVPVDATPFVEEILDDARPAEVNPAVDEISALRAAPTQSLPGFRRVWAWMIDAACVYVSALSVSIAANTGTSSDRIHRIPMWLAIATFGVVAAYVVVGTAVGGRTLGKALTGLRVIRPDGGPVGWGRSSIRATIALAPWWVTLLPIRWIALVSYGWLLVLAASTALDAEHRGLHDRAAGTVVVRS